MTSEEELKIKVTLHASTGPEHAIPIYEVVLTDGKGEWPETYGNLMELNAFLQGVRAGRTMRAEKRFTLIPRIAPPASGWSLFDVPRVIWPAPE